MPGLISLSIRGKDGESIMHRMDLKGISISTGAACDFVDTQGSHVIKAIQVPNEFAQGTIRISLRNNTTHEEVMAIADTLCDILLK